MRLSCQLLALLSGFVLVLNAQANPILQTKGGFQDKFRQLDEDLPTANDYRNAAGEPGKAYWQQQVDYKIEASLDENLRRLSAKQQVTYHNNSPYRLKYLWLQLEQNRFKADSIGELTQTIDPVDADSARMGEVAAQINIHDLRRQQFLADTPMGYELGKITDANGTALKYTVVGEQMRIDLPKPLAAGETMQFKLEYSFNILEEDAVDARSGFEHFPDDKRKNGNDIFMMAQWFPRLSAYSDYEAWHNKAFLGSGEFTLEFGDYDVKLTVPKDHIIASTGELQNPEIVMTKQQAQRLKQAEKATKPVFIVTPDEALKNESSTVTGQKTWHFKAKNVRDFAWASSRKFIWDAKGYQQGGDTQANVMAMSFYPKEGGELWQRYSTESVIHTMEVYSRFTFDYPYPTAISVNGPVGGMEYPMISFNGPRTIWHPEDESRTYTLSEKQFLIGVVIHEVGHNYFPMIVNSDERQWTWMDEGLNSFLDGVASKEWDPKLDWGREARDVIEYMKSDVQVPVMTQSDSVLKLGPNAYTKPAVALNILREVILGRELFDFAFKEYALRWENKRPTPADFFRTMEEASGVDLDWFFHGWFYTTDHVDISLDKIYKLRLDSLNPDIDFKRQRQDNLDKPSSYFSQNNKTEGKKVWVGKHSDNQDFHDKHDKFTVTNQDRNDYQQMLADLEPWERQALERAIKEDQNYYVLEFSNLGGLVMPLLLELSYEDGTVTSMNIPAEIWRKSPHHVSKLIITDKDKVLASVALDPSQETADVDIENNFYPRRIIQSRIEAFKDDKDDAKDSRDLMFDFKAELEEPETKEFKK
ncbi:M1 family metallopeptidase [Shewanella sp. SR44-3]|uniref:M1 family metallopeptidase n=1 Tax=Shewanella sp. SR44-3 TaxID=2760936 RepID=UPI0015FDAE51|nr:M1 family metallopeptidase [Shewanella sp. SR44-3]MBB1270801.1 M1 family metallopeptidase [Shewanella sp. SR44-3]